MNTPMNNNISNQNENLFFKSYQNMQQNTNVNQYFIERDDQSSKEFVIRFISHNIFVYSLPFLVILFSIFIPSTFPNIDSYLKIAYASSGVIFSLILMIFCVYKVKLIKDTLNGKVIVKVINYLYFPKMKFKLDIENTHFYVLTEISQDENGQRPTFRLLIINDYKNLVGIDYNFNNLRNCFISKYMIDTSNIKQKPAKFFYSFNNPSRGNYDHTQFSQILNNFIGNSGVYDNPYCSILINI